MTQYDRPPADLKEALRAIDRRLTPLERRSVPSSAADLLGPGYGPRAVLTQDWNSDECSFSGQFWSPIGSINGPDPTIEWIGHTMAQDESFHGVQVVHSAGVSIEPRRLSRRWWSNDAGATRIYSPWVGDYPYRAVPVQSPYATGTTQPVQVCMRGNGQVSYRGLINTGDAGGNWGLNTSRLVVPVGGIPEAFRPTGQPFQIGALLGSNNWGRLQVQLDGSVTLVTYDQTGSFVEFSSVAYVIASVAS